MRRLNLSGKTVLVLVLLIYSCKKDETKVTTPSGNIETVAGMGPPHFGFGGDGGAATSAKLGYLTGIASDASGNLYISDGSSNVIRMVTAATGKITTIAGVYLGDNVVDMTPYFGDGGVATSAHLNVPFGVAVAVSGNVYIADAGNNVVRKIDSSTGVITTFAGLGMAHQEYAGDGGLATAASLFNPYDVAVDGSENVYIVDSQHNVIRSVNASTGIITTIAGNGTQGYQGDGNLATDAQLSMPQGVTVDLEGNVYISDSGNNVVRKVTKATGIITTLAGIGTAGYSGDGGLATAAKLSSPHGLTVDALGNVYVTDPEHHVIRKVSSATSTISTVAGTGEKGYTGDGGFATSARLYSPAGVAVDGAGNLYIVDDNAVVRKVTRL